MLAFDIGAARPVGVAVLLLGALFACKKPAMVDDLDPTPACLRTLPVEQRAAFRTGVATYAKTLPRASIGVRDFANLWGDDSSSLEAVISGCALEERFAAEGGAAIAAPRETLQRLLVDYRSRPQRGVLHAPRGWYREEIKVSGMTDDQVSMRLFDLFAGSRYGGGAYYGFIEIGTADRPDGTRNSVVFFVGRVLEELRKVKGANFVDPQAALVRPIFVDMTLGKLRGAMWSRTPLPSERSYIVQTIDTSR